LFISRLLLMAKLFLTPGVASRFAPGDTLL